MSAPQIETPAQILNAEPEKTYNNSPVREYVDQVLSLDTDVSVINLVFSLRKQYARQKIEKPGKKVHKNYVFGIKEVLKHIEAKNIKLLVVTPNIEKIECEGGLDSFLTRIFTMCRAQKVPVVFALSMSKLGLVAKSKGTKVALLGVLKYQGSEELFREVVKLAEEGREEFYRKNEGRFAELRMSPFFAGSKYLIEKESKPESDH